MPEGDTIYRTAATLDKALAGSVAVRVAGSAPAVHAWGRRLAGRSIERVDSIGKHLLISFEGDLGIRTHLGMPGSWHLYRPEERWHRTPGAARVVIATEEWVAVCFAAPDVDAGRTPELLGDLAHLGPDLMRDDLDLNDVVGRIDQLDGDTAVADVLVDQRVMAGVGNVIKSETLFLERLHPLAPVGLLYGEDRRRLVDTARRLLRANRGGGPRIATGDRQRGGRLWVYDRAGRACRRCGSAIAEAHLGKTARITYWCPHCQPEAGPP